MKLLQKICALMCLILNAVACAMRTRDNGVQGRRARSARYSETLLCPSGAAILAALPTQARCLRYHWDSFNREPL